MATRTVRVAYFQEQTGLRLVLTEDPLGSVFVAECDLTESDMLGSYHGELVDVPTGRYVVYIVNEDDQTLSDGVLQHTDEAGSERVDDIVQLIIGSGGLVPNLVVSASAPELDVVDVDGDLTFYRGDTIRVSLTDLGSLVGRTKLWFCGKQHTGKTDSEADVFVEEGAGLITIDGDTPDSAADGVITVTDEDAGDIEIEIKAAASQLLEEFIDGYYDIQVKIGDNVTTLARGQLTVTGDVARSVS